MTDIIAVLVCRGMGGGGVFVIVIARLAQIFPFRAKIRRNLPTVRYRFREIFSKHHRSFPVFSRNLGRSQIAEMHILLLMLMFLWGSDKWNGIFAGRDRAKSGLNDKSEHWEQVHCTEKMIRLRKENGSLPELSVEVPTLKTWSTKNEYRIAEMHQELYQEFEHEPETESVGGVPPHTQTSNFYFNGFLKVYDDDIQVTFLLSYLLR